ncbi:MAG TPA: OmpA family protein [Gemmatimonadota bacterium]|nr:OmpA family protein [Gemmatimonadota bacterium]
MKFGSRGLIIGLIGVGLALTAQPAHAQFGDQIRRTATRAAKGEVLREVDRQVRKAVRCALHDLECIKRAEEQGQPVEVVDEDGRVVAVNDAPAANPGEDAWANYDFVPGERVLLYEDFGNDNVGDFPRRLDFVRGNWDVVELNGQRLLRNTGPRHSAFRVPLPESLPERFTIEFSVLLYEGNANLALSTSPPDRGAEHQYRLHHYTHNYFDVGSWGVGVTSRDGNDPTSSQRVDEELTSGLVPIRIMADGQHVKMYVGEQRVANVPNADLERADTLWIENTYAASEEKPILIGAIRVSAGGRDLYDALAAEGRVATQGILFDIGSDRIRPESTPTLEKIGTMLAERPDLRLVIEGHTDSLGDDAMNQTLSERRAAAIKAYLLEAHGIDPARLETAGYGETRPVADNGTPEGRQQNRRVELVRR